MSLTKEQALRAYATMMNTLDVSCLAPLLADDFHYASQWVFAEIESKPAYLEYIVPKLDAIRKSGAVAGPLRCAVPAFRPQDGRLPRTGPDRPRVNR